MATSWIHAFPSTGCSGLVIYEFGGLRDVTSPLILVAGLGLLCLGVAGCGWGDFPDSDLIGTYVGRYEGGRVEVFHVREDGTFDQTLSQEGKTIYRNQGTWAIDRGRVVFSDILPPDRAEGGGLIWMPRFFGAIYAGWSPRQRLIEFDTVIHVRKESSDVPPKDPDMPRMRDAYRKEHTGDAVRGEP
jgi:hypothetical protein